MREFFRGWKCKIGVVTLLLACVFTAGWVRSRLMTDVLLVPTGSRQQMFASIEGQVYWWGATRNGVRWYADSISDPVSATIAKLNAERTIIKSTSGTGFVEWVIPYWTLAIPLALLSAWLLLGKLRVAKPRMASENPIPPTP